MCKKFTISREALRERIEEFQNNGGKITILHPKDLPFVLPLRDNTILPPSLDMGSYVNITYRSKNKL